MRIPSLLRRAATLPLYPILAGGLPRGPQLHMPNQFDVYTDIDVSGKLAP